MDQSIITTMRAPLASEYRVPAAHLEAALFHAGVTQSELARRLEVSQVTVNRWARGRAPISRSRWLAALAALGLPTSWQPEQVG